MRDELCQATAARDWGTLVEMHGSRKKGIFATKRYHPDQAAVNE